MIFKTLFTPAHKHDDPEKRKASIDKLDPSKENDKRILHELAFNDASDAVSLTALSKLDSFILWMKSLETTASPIVKKKAESVCLQALENSNIVDDNLFESFIKESKNKSMLSTLLFSSKRLQQHESLSFNVLCGLANEQVTRRYFSELATESQQLNIVQMTTDAKLLTRYNKQTKYQSVIDLIAEKSKQAELAKLMPAKVKQTVTLINSRLLALKEAQDYAYLEQEFAQLNKEFGQAKADFGYLDEQTSAQLSEKYLQLKAMVSDKLVNLAEQHKEQLALNKTTEDLSDLRERLKDVEQQITLLLTSDDPQIDSQVKILSGAVCSTEEEMDALSDAAKTAAHNQLFKTLQNQIVKMHASLQDLPRVIEHSQQVNALIQKLNESIEPFVGREQVDPETVAIIEREIKEAKTAFEQLKKQSNVLPQAKINEFNKALSDVSKQLKLFKDFYRNIERKCENKLKVVDRMIADGKFKSAMSTFHYVQKLVDSLPEAIDKTTNTRLLKAYTTTSEEIKKLQDWQAYIAQPRKPALLEETIKLADETMHDAYTRVEAVKQLRAQWQSFGLLHTEEDDALNKAFDEAIEKAFAPCRTFFAELDKTRAENLTLAAAIVSEAFAIDDNIPASQLASVVGGLKSRINKIGEIEKSELRKIKRQFGKALDPLHKRIDQFYAENAQLKQKLVDKVTFLVAQEESSLSLQEATEQAKALQKQWKTIGFAGKNAENKLWQLFRENNDQLFSRYQAQVNHQQEQTEQQLREFEKQIEAFTNQLKGAKFLADLSFYNDAQQSLEQATQQVDDKTQNRMKNKLRKLHELYLQVNQKLESARANEEINKLFTFLKAYTTTERPATFDSLANQYKTWIKGDLEVIDVLKGLSRDDLVQVAQIMANDNSNSLEYGDENRRKELQMLLMAAKLGGNDVVTKESALAVWVSMQQVSTADMAGLLVLEKLFTTTPHENKTSD